MFKKATKKQSKLRLALSGTSGAGKTYTALRIASGMSDKIALIDTEYGSASKYASIFNFDTLELKVASIDNYVKAIMDAGNSGYEVLIIDSISHAWDFLLDEVEKIAKAKCGGNTFRAWAEGTPLQKKFINAILASPCHVICTMRVKTEYAVEANEKGRMTPRKVGLAPRQREGLEYEFDMLMEGNNDHFFLVSKDRTGKYQDKIIEKPSEEFGKELIDWLNDGEEVKIETASLGTLNKLVNLVKILEVKDNIINVWLNTESVSNINNFTEEQAQKYIKACEKQLQKKDAEKKIEMTKKIMNEDETKAETNLSDEQEKFLQEQKL
jgi:hypothetical protein